MWLFKFDNCTLPNFIFLIHYMFNFYGTNFPLKITPFEPIIVRRYFKHYFVSNTSRFCGSIVVKCTCKKNRVLCKKNYVEKLHVSINMSTVTRLKNTIIFHILHFYCLLMTVYI